MTELEPNQYMNTKKESQSVNVTQIPLILNYIGVFRTEIKEFSFQVLSQRIKGVK